MLLVKDISFSFGTIQILNTISFNVKKGEHVSIIGESGSGKSTLLKLIYGEYDTDNGEIFWKNTKILGPKHNLVIGYDFMKYVSQEFDLMPYTTVAENIGKFLSRFYPEEKDKRTKELIEIVDLKAFTNTKVKTLSGGQKQRVALARALAKEPEILLLDEPFSNIDNFKKQHLRRNVFNYLKLKNITCIVATHDKNDVLGFADNMIVLKDRKILKTGSPEFLYTSKEDKFITSFFGEYSTINGQLFYAHDIRLSDFSDYRVLVSKSYFRGNYVLIEAVLNNEIIYFHHHEPLQKDTFVFIEF